MILDGDETEYFVDGAARHGGGRPAGELLRFTVAECDVALVVGNDDGFAESVEDVGVERRSGSGGMGEGGSGRGAVGCLGGRRNPTTRSNSPRRLTW